MAQYAKVLLVTAAFTAATAAPAAISILGSGQGRACFEAAAANRPLKPSVATCTAALENEAQSARDHAATLVNRGILYMQAQNIVAALMDYDAALEIMPGLAEAYVNKGIALVHLGGRDAEAVAQLTAGLDRKPAHPEVAYYTRAIAYEMTGATREAYEDYKQAAELAPGWAEPAAQLLRFQIIRKPTAAA